MTNLPFVPEDPGLPGLKVLFEEAGPPVYIREAAGILAPGGLSGTPKRSYVRYWPGRRCVVQWTFEDGGTPLAVVSAELLSARGASRQRAGIGVYLSDRRVWVQVFPADNVLVAIRTAVSDAWINEHLAPKLGVAAGSITARPVSYKSWRRCVIEYTAGDRRYYGKIFRDDRGGRLAAIQAQFRAALAAEGRPWDTPETVFYDASLGMLVQAELSGASSLSDILRRVSGEPEQKELLLAAVRAAAAGLGATQAIALDGLETQGPEDVISALDEDRLAMDSVAHEEAEPIKRAVRTLKRMYKRLEPEVLVPSHSAFRHSHVYTTPDARLSLLDLDNLRLSGANADAGYFLAYLQLTWMRRQRLRGVLDECHDAFLDVWSRQPNYDAQWLAFHTQAVLLKWALRSFYSLDRDWWRTVQAVAVKARQTYEAAMVAAKAKLPEVEGGLMTMLGAGDRLRRIGPSEIAPQLWPQAETVKFKAIESAYAPGEDMVVKAEVTFKEKGASRKERVVATFPLPEYFEGAAALAARQGEGVFVSPRGDYIAEVFPRDYLLPGLERAVDDEYMLGLISRAGLVERAAVVGFDHDVLRYRPHERCVVRYSLRLGAGGQQLLVAKVYDDEETAREVWSTLRSLRAQLVDPSLVVEPLALDPETFVVVMENVDGDSVGRLMDSTVDVAETRRYVDMTAAALATLHGLTLQHDRVKNFASELEKLRVHAAAVTTVTNDLGRALGEALDAVEAAAAGLDEPNPTFVHGGFKPTQMLTRDGKVTVVDFDGSCVGDPAIDVGRFMAKTRLDCLEPNRAHLRGLDEYFLDSYANLSRHDVRPRARLYQALSLVRMASRRFETGTDSFVRGGGLRGSASGALLREALLCLQQR